MDVLERDRETRKERRGQETKDGGIVEGGLEVKGWREGRERSWKEERYYEWRGRQGRGQRRENEMMERFDSG